MACGGAKSEDEKKETQRSKEIEKMLKDEMSKERKTIKLLLLGTGDSGKSTFAKQMTVVHKKGFQKEDFEKFRPVLRENCLVSMQKLLWHCQQEKLELPGKLETPIKNIASAQPDGLNEKLAADVTKVWENEAVRKALKKHGDTLQIPSTASYFFDNATKFGSSSFTPSQDDILRAKLRTTGISENKFIVDEFQFVMVDVGGQRSERRKWLHCFNDVNAVIFLTAGNEYDMVLEEDGKTNRMEESIRLFQKLTASPWFKSTAFILFLNKSDLLREKVKTKPLKNYFKNYAAWAEASKVPEEEKPEQFVISKFVEVYGGPKETLYPFVTNALDTGNCDRVFKSVKAIFATAKTDEFLGDV